LITEDIGSDVPILLVVTTIFQTANTVA